MSVLSGTGELLKAARELYARAVEEFKEGVDKGDALTIRDVAEKAWNSVVHATNALILNYEGVVPDSHYERRRYLQGLEQKIKAVEDAGLVDRYMARNRGLHGEAFYEGLIEIERLKVELGKAKKYIEDVGKLLQVP